MPAARAAGLLRHGLVLGVVGGEVGATPPQDRLVVPSKIGGKPKPVLAPHRGFHHRGIIVKRLEQTPHLTLNGLRGELAARGVNL